MTPLESFITCFKCEDTTVKKYYPFIFLAFEDLDFYSTGTTYSYNENTTTNHPMLDVYEVFTDRSYGNGYMQRCLSLETSNFFPNS